ncbi:VOC family protein [Gordonia sp. NPDC003424]
MTNTATSIPLITGIAQVKLPVTDLARSVAWYRDVLGLRFWTEFVEDGEVRGVGLIDDDARFNVALRLREHCANEPDLHGFDIVAFTPGSRAALDVLAERCGRLAVTCSAIADGPEGARLDIPDPDGTVLRFYHFTAPTSGFTGIVLEDGQLVSTYDSPRLDL